MIVACRQIFEVAGYSLTCIVDKKIRAAVNLVLIELLASIEGQLAHQTGWAVHRIQQESPAMAGNGLDETADPIDREMQRSPGDNTCGVFSRGSEQTIKQCPFAVFLMIAQRLRGLGDPQFQMSRAGIEPESPVLKDISDDDLLAIALRGRRQRLMSLRIGSETDEGVDDLY